MAFQSRDNNRPRFNNRRNDDRPGERRDRFERNDRSDRPDRFDRSDRPARFERSDRPARFDRNERGERPARFDRNDRGERSERPNRFGPGSRNERPARFDRGERRPAPRPGMAPRAPRPEAPADAPKNYLDFEYHEPAPVRAPRTLRVEAVPMEPAVPENLLAGRNPIREALKSGRDIEKLLVQRGELSGSAREIVQMAKEAHIVVQEVDKIRLDEIAPHHQGMLAFASSYAYSTVEAMLQKAADLGEAPFLILLDGITDPHNLGAIIRSASCAGAHGVIVPERRSVGLTPAAVKASAGAVEHVPVAKVTNLTRTLEDLKSKGIWAYAVTMQGEDYRKVDFAGGVALVIGSEGEGISRLTLEACDCKVSLPLKGEVDSLNASVAAGIMMYRVMETRA